MTYNAHLLDGIIIFAEVVSAGSFTRAADNTGHSTSYISKEIARLEERLGTRLLNRTTRSQHLTAEGRLYYQQCQQIIADVSNAQNALMGQQQQPAGTLKVSCPVSFGMAQMRGIFSDFLQHYPQVGLEIDFNNLKVDIVADGFDVVIRATPQLEDSSLISRRVMRSRAVTLAAPSYLQQYGTPQRPEELAEHHCITYSGLKTPRLWHYRNQYGKDIQVEVNSRVSSNSSEMEISLCLAGHGIVCMPSFLFTNEISSGRLIELFTDYQPMVIDIYLIYPSRKHMSAKVRCFIDFVAGRLAQRTGI
ncbi:MULTISPECIES: LysR family transcriptional regulator [unclassified Oceanobacter]|jgi:DNA-binding transcriptional LysR family regulator|uniref:LysR family transcriptional regulator n=1 Tax=unclassified Oceanobacter TaxID=2620260 RepID=UPI002732EF25|nr:MULTISPECIES: LysR family transcriptional regulator [unclassified Oceanobacter]MDP2609103.1 LysR family transcriptional regulator [Oceanobacter sp. 1_MG-2023]MDP2612425.1 LysR family transcriptional regulator [Oceanobacter sp. 2_MG-2023]